MAPGAGSYGYLRRLHHQRAAGMLAWVLVVGYVLTVSVYAFTFGHYLSVVLDLGAALWPRVFAVGVVVLLVLVNLRGVGDSQRLEVVTVWAKLAILVGPGAVGLWRFDPGRLAEGVSGGGAVGVLVGAGTLVEQKEVALAIAGRAALGTAGLVVVTVGAVFATGSAINATLFATARLARDVASGGDYPGWVAHTNRHGAPDRAVLVLGGVAAALAAVGGLTVLVEAGSLVFLLMFAVVGGIAWRQKAGHRFVAVLGCLSSAAAGTVLTVRLAAESPSALAALAGLVGLTLVLQPRVARRERRR